MQLREILERSLNDTLIDSVRLFKCQNQLGKMSEVS